MMNLIATTTATAKSYADKKNARYSSSKSAIRSVAQRWKETYDNLSFTNKLVVDQILEQAKAEFRRLNPNLKKWKQLLLAEAKTVKMNQVNIDGTMQRQLDIFWVLTLLNKFLATKVVPIQVYRPDPQKDEFLAWDGQHTLVLLWLIATHLLEEDPANCNIPVNIYHSHLKAEMRSTFISHNGPEGKKQLEMIDIWEQMVYGVRIDNSTNPIWVAAELKQQYIEQVGLFVTSKKFNDDDEPGAISRLQEIHKLTPESVKYLAQYLALATKLQRPVEEKEMVMMAHYFDRCRISSIDIDTKYVVELVQVIDKVWGGDFGPSGMFWIKASNAYNNWHTAANAKLASMGVHVPAPKFKKEPVHGFPYLVAQLAKSMKHSVPHSDSNSSFCPLVSDLV
jgi:hypothetical protein